MQKENICLRMKVSETREKRAIFFSSKRIDVIFNLQRIRDIFEKPPLGEKTMTLTYFSKFSSI